MPGCQKWQCRWVMEKPRGCSAAARTPSHPNAFLLAYALLLNRQLRLHPERKMRRAIVLVLARRSVVELHLDDLIGADDQLAAQRCHRLRNGDRGGSTGRDAVGPEGHVMRAAALVM